MYMFQSEFEDAALKAYFEDPWTESEDSSEEGIDGEHKKERLQKEGGELELSGRGSRVDDEKYEGGSSSKSNKK